MKRTLLLDSNSKTALCQCLHLTLAGHRVRECRTAADALNGILAAKDGPDPFDFLIVSRYPADIPFCEFLQFLRAGTPHLRILVFRRPENPPPLPECDAHWCLPDDAVEAAESSRTPSPLRSAGAP